MSCRCRNTNNANLAVSPLERKGLAAASSIWLVLPPIVFSDFIPTAGA